jgi:hypothetical protein
MKEETKNNVIEEWLIENAMSPESAASIISDSTSFSEEEVMEYIEAEFPLTSSPGRRGYKYCLRCNPHLNGMMGKDGTEAVAKHKIVDIRGMDQEITGWEGLCYDCASVIKDNPHVVLFPLEGNEDLDLFAEEEEVEHVCEDPEWRKTSLVTEKEGFDWVKCEKCGIKAKRHGMNRYEIVGYD